jgi:hypothetical protein
MQNGVVSQIELQGLIEYQHGLALIEHMSGTNKILVQGSTVLELTSYYITGTSLNLH